MERRAEAMMKQARTLRETSVAGSPSVRGKTVGHQPFAGGPLSDKGAEKGSKGFSKGSEKGDSELDRG